MSLGLTGVAAAADPVTGIRGVTGGVSVVNAIGAPVELPVGLITLRIGENKIATYCIQNGTTIAHPKYREAAWAEASVTDLDHIHWALVHGWPTVSADALLAAAGATRPDLITDERLGILLYTGTQAAVWHYSNPENFKLGAHADITHVPAAAEYDVIVKVHDYLTGDKNTGKSEPVSLAITPDTGTGQVGTKVGPYTVQSGGGPAALTATGGTLVDAAGNPVDELGDGDKFWVTSDTVGDVTIDAKGSAQVPIGRVFVATELTNASQKLILGAPAGEAVKAHAKATFTAKPSPTPTPTAGPALPITGPAVTGAALAGLLLVGAGFVLVMALRRRRRIEFKA
jgi:hypothetical protein